jgi:hypothetical protein
MDVNLLRTHVIDEWNKIYDASYIENFVVGGLQIKMVKMADLLAALSKKATGKVSDLVSTLGTNYVGKNMFQHKTFRKRNKGKRIQANTAQALQANRTQDQGHPCSYHDSQNRQI